MVFERALKDIMAEQREAWLRDRDDMERHLIGLEGRVDDAALQIANKDQVGMTREDMKGVGNRQEGNDCHSLHTVDR